MPNASCSLLMAGGGAYTLNASSPCGSRSAGKENGMEIKQQLRLSQQLVMTPQLQQAIKLLQMSRMELVDMVREELMENPVLEDTLDQADAVRADRTEQNAERAEINTIDQQINADDRVVGLE